MSNSRPTQASPHMASAASAMARPVSASGPSRYWPTVAQPRMPRIAVAAESKPLAPLVECTSRPSRLASRPNGLAGSTASLRTPTSVNSFRMELVPMAAMTNSRSTRPASSRRPAANPASKARGSVSVISASSSGAMRASRSRNCRRRVSENGGSEARLAAATTSDSETIGVCRPVVLGPRCDRTVPA